VNEIDYGDIGKRVAFYRGLNEMTGDELAARAGNGISRAVLANIETGRKKDISIVHLTALSNALDIPFTALLFDLTKPYAPSPFIAHDGRNGDRALPVWMALRYLSAFFPRSTPENMPAHFESIMAISAFENWQRARRELKRAHDAIDKFMQAHGDGPLSESEESFIKYLSKSIPNMERNVETTRETVDRLGLDVADVASEDEYL
jgi:transcriptional regulator with XRE-family HTH domain